MFSFGVLPSKYSGSVAGLQFGLGFAKTIFGEEKDFAKPRLIFWWWFPPARRRGLGRNAGGFSLRILWWRLLIKVKKFSIIAM